MALRLHALVLYWVAMTRIGIGVLGLVGSEFLLSLRGQPDCSAGEKPIQESIWKWGLMRKLALETDIGEILSPQERIVC